MKDPNLNEEQIPFKETLSYDTNHMYPNILDTRPNRKPRKRKPENRNIKISLTPDGGLVATEEGE